MSDTSPRAVFERLIDGISRRAWGELFELYAENAVVRIPFGAPGPTLIEGREALRERFTSPDRPDLELTAHNVVVHETADPEVIIAEFDYLGRVVATDHAFEVSNIQVLRVRDGLILSSRDYHDHAAFGRAMA
jgi:ketosteroid isomerase-like protein